MKIACIKGVSVLMLAALFFVSPGSVWSKDGFINAVELLGLTQAYKDGNARLETFQNVGFLQVDQEEKKIESLYYAFEEKRLKSDKLKKDQSSDDLRTIENQKMIVDQLKQKIFLNIQEIQAEITLDVMKEISDLARELMKKRGLSYVWTQSALLSWDDKKADIVDLTQEAKDILTKKLSAANLKGPKITKKD